MRIARIRVRVIEKETRRTWIVIPGEPHEPICCMLTGRKVAISPGRSGFTEINDRGQPVLDSWVSETMIVVPIF